MTSAIRDGFSSAAYEPVAQTFFGLRAFRIHDEGSTPSGPARSGVMIGDDAHRGGLRGIFKYTYQWGAGGNHALCLRSSRPQAVDMVNGKPHALMMPDCDCGFWAYTADSHVLSVTGPAVLGVIEGWGRCVLGPHGFRAEKARIVGLAFPTGREVDAATMIDAAAAHVNDTLRQAGHVMTTMFGQTAANFAAVIAGRKPKPIPIPPAPERSTRPWERVDADLVRDVRRGYPDVAVFDTVSALREAFPLSDLTALLPDAATGSEAAS
jgi:hypothetical protein